MSTQLKTGAFVFGISSSIMSIFESSDFYFGLIIREKPLHILSLSSLFISPKIQEYGRKEFYKAVRDFRDGRISFEFLNRKYDKLVYVIRLSDWETRFVIFPPTASGYQTAIDRMQLLSNVTAEEAKNRTLPFEDFQRHFLKPSDSFQSHTSPKLSL